MFTWFAKLIGADTSGVDETNARTDAAIAQLNTSALNKGVISPATFQEYSANIARSNAANFGPAAAQVDGAFAAGLSEGFSSVTNGISSGINFPLKFLWAAIPIWVWVGVAVWLAWEFGLLKRFVRKP